MNFDESLARMRRDRTLEGEPEPFVHLLVGEYSSPVRMKQGLYAGFACDPDSTKGVRAPIFCRTVDPPVATCPGCVAAITASATN